MRRICPASIALISDAAAIALLPGFIATKCMS
jgi:hypothetical protein